MTSVLVDSSVLLDIATVDATWATWSEATLQALADTATLVINPLIYAEVAVRYATVEEVDELVSANLFRREPLPYEAAFLAGKCFVAYRRRGGTRTSPMPDFYIGAHAAVRGYRLLIRDPGRFRTYFPTVGLIAP